MDRPDVSSVAGALGLVEQARGLEKNKSALNMAWIIDDKGTFASISALGTTYVMRILNLLVLLALSSMACGDPPPSEYPTQKAHTADARFAAGDTFEVRVYRQADLSGAYEVSGEGSISFPLIGMVQAEGKTPSEVEREIHDRLADGYLKSPNVSVLVKELKSKSVSVLGEVSKPVTLPFTDGMTLIDVIAEAGGFTAMARKNAVTVTRTIEGKKTRYTVPAGDIGDGKADNFFIRPGDVVSIPRRTW